MSWRDIARFGSKQIGVAGKPPAEFGPRAIVSGQDVLVSVPMSHLTAEKQT
jgi:hypothetical protein